MANIVLEKSKVSPPPNTPPEFSLPVVFFDLLWYEFPASQLLLFFKLPCSSKSHFLDTILPALKKSLSLTLAHFLPLAGNIIHPLIPGDRPILRYQSGDSVPFTASESGADFNHLTGNHPRRCEEFYILAPQLPRASRSGISISLPVVAVQATLFPGRGICIGFAAHHAVADASTVVSFLQAWALIYRTPRPGRDFRALLKGADLLPSYDRNTLRNLGDLESMYWGFIVESRAPVDRPPVKLPTGRLQATFVLKEDDLERLKNWAEADGVAHPSSFTVTCALVWACLAKSEVAEDDEMEYFCFVADCRGRMKPSLPANYFGNCLALVKTELKHGQVKGGGGFVMAAKAIGDTVKENVYGEKGILHGAENWEDEYCGLIGKRKCSVSGSPRFDFYAVDYGWGKPAKYEKVDGGEAICLNKSREFEGGVEFGMSRPEAQMEAFARVFSQFLAHLRARL